MSRKTLTLIDRTDESWRRLKAVPDGSAVPPEPSALCLSDTKACMAGTRRTATVPSYFPRLTGWDPIHFEDWIFAQSPLLIGAAGKRELNITIGKPAPSGYTVKIFSTDFGSDLWPMATAVAIPKDIPTDRPPSFLVLFQNTPMQNPTDSSYRHFRPPWGWDWLYLQFWRWFGLHTVPICTSWTAWGLPYQLTRANKKFVLVIPQMPVDTLARDPGRYALLSGEAMSRLLSSLQAAITPEAAGEPAHVALAGFSNGNLILADFFKHNLAKGAAAADRAMAEKVKETYVLAPPEQEWAGTAILDQCRAWKAAVPAGVIRAYTHAVYGTAYERLLGRRVVTKDVPFDGDNAAGDISLSYLPYTPADNVWSRTCKTLGTKVPNCPCARVGFDNVHHWIPALCLTHAAARSPFL
ncbi:hypothetical protein [Nonomuraea sp. LPB2021202275-12-8]|uniref:hypothetical protein n=1 Tax=Nonomuraea sp. LPB2021202275-12-8 TaxID=3120159 RepID=UPI00300C596A